LIPPIAAPAPGQIPLPPEAVEQDIPAQAPAPEQEDRQEIVMKEILDRIDDALRVERDFRKRGQTILQIYRGELDASGTYTKDASRYNILNANVGILLPSLYSQNPKPEVRSKGFSNPPGLDAVVSALDKILTSFMDNRATYDAHYAAIQELLLPGRGQVRVRWDPIVEEVAPDPMMPDQTPVHEKLLDMMSVEHVYWEDFTHEQTSSWETVGWVAFRHLFTEKVFEAHFADSVAYQKYVAEGKKDEVFRWTDKSAYSALGKETQQSRSAYSSSDLQDVIKKALVWEFWDKSTREVIWICQDMNGSVLRIDPDVLKLRGFFPCPKPLLAVTTSDRLIPTAEYVIYQDLAAELDLISERINALTSRLKIRGAYNGAQEELADILTASDGVMKAINGLDYNFELSKNIYVVDISPVVGALQQLYIARENAKQAMYEITGISDIVRGETRASETLGAQRMKTAFASLRIQTRKTMVENFCRDVVRIMAEIVSEHFSPESIMYYTGVQLGPEEAMLLQNDGLRLSNIDIQTDSTMAPNDQEDQQQIGMMLQSLAQVMQQIVPMVTGGMMPLPIAFELMKMATKPFKHSADLTQLLNQYAAMLMGGMGPQQLPGMMPPGAPPGSQPPGATPPGENMPQPSGSDTRLM
jgi:hypothetical protein